MRTTIDIDDDLLAAAREIAQRERVSAGQVVSRLLRAALAGTVTPPHPLQPGATVTSDFRPFASRGIPVTNADIDRLRDVEGA